MHFAQALEKADATNETRSGQYQLLTLPALAKLLARTPAGLRATIQSQSNFGQSLRRARVKLGRRVYFRGDLIDRLIVESTGQ